jgi:hypothetical protein
MPTLEEFLKKHYDERVRREEKTIRQLLREYARLDKALGRVYAEFERTLDAARGDAATRRVPVSWLHKNKRLKGLLDAVRAELGKFGGKASTIIERSQADEIESRKTEAAELLKLFFEIKRAKIPPSGPQNGPGRMGDGSKLTDYFHKKLGQLVEGRVRRAAVNSVIAESGKAAKKLKAAHGIVLNRALTTARTETMRVGRAASLGIYARNGFEWWIWHAQLSPKTCGYCRKMHGTRHRIGAIVMSHPRCRCTEIPDGEADVSKPRHDPQPVPAGETFTGTLRGETLSFPNVPMMRIRYTKRPAAEREKLRSIFDRENTGVRARFLKSLVDNRDKIEHLRGLGVPDWLIENMKRGKIGTRRWQVHHKYPLDDGGTNDFDNLIFIKNDPLHIAITNYQNAITRGLATGQTTVITFPVPQGSIYATGGRNR